MDAVNSICKTENFDELKELMNGLYQTDYVIVGYDDKGKELIGKEFMYEYPNTQRVRMVVHPTGLSDIPTGLCDIQILHPSSKSPNRIKVLPVKHELHALALREAIVILGLVRSVATD